MKRIASILIRLSFGLLFFVASAHALDDTKIMTANIPFEFTVGSISFPAGQYKFLRVGDNTFQVRDADGRSLFIMATAPIRPNEPPEKSMLKFANVDGRHVLIQIWNGHAAMGNEFENKQYHVELAKRPTVDVSAN
jgi:hypothetical protein